MGIEYGSKNLYKEYGIPTLDLTFSGKKSLVDRISGNNLITFTRSSTATYIGSDGLVKYASANEGRLDYDQTTGESLGLLIEEARTNYMSNNTTNLFTMAYSNWTSDSTIMVEQLVDIIHLINYLEEDFSWILILQEIQLILVLFGQD